MNAVTLYTTPFCGYCAGGQAAAGAEGDRLHRDRRRLGSGEKRRDGAAARGRMTLPQIFIGERHIGGCDDMVALERAGELDRLLAA